MVETQIASSAGPREQPITGNTLLFPVVGHPIAQVRAPEVFNALFDKAGVDALCLGLDLPPQDVVAACRLLLASPNVGGMLVTVPYKKVLADTADRLGMAATHVGAVNALRRCADGKIEGNLFDGHGFVRGLRAAGHAVAETRVLLLGCGGAGSAIGAALADAGVGLLGVYDPVAAAVDTLLARLQLRFARTVFQRQTIPQATGFDIVVNASPLGLDDEDPLPMDPAGISPGTLVCDIIMEPATTRFLEAALTRGLRVHYGRHMLDQQVPSYLSFFGMQALADRVRITPDAVLLDAT